MPEVVKVHVPESGLLDSPQPDAAEVVPTKLATSCSGEDQTRTTRLGMQLEMHGQLGSQRRRERDGTDASRTLGSLDQQPVRPSLGERAAYGDSAPFEVHVTPLQSAQLSEAQAGKAQDRPNFPVLGFMQPPWGEPRRSGPTSGYCGQVQRLPESREAYGPRSLAPWQLLPKAATPPARSA